MSKFDYNDINKAYNLISSYLIKTPLVTSDYINKITGAKNVLFNIEAENTHNKYFSNSKNEKLLNHANDIDKASELWDFSAKLCDLPIKLEI